MDPDIVKLFCQAQPVNEGTFCQTQEYKRKAELTQAILRKMGKCYGEEAAGMLLDFYRVLRDMEMYKCLHYFQQGYLAAGKDPETTPEIK